MVTAAAAPVSGAGAADPAFGCAAVGAPPEDGVHGDLGWALATVLRSYGRAADAALAGLPGGPRGYRLLSAVVRDCPRSQLALAQHVGLDRTVVTYLVDDLAGLGLLERQANPADRRTRRVVATAAGRARLGELEQGLSYVEAHVLGGLSEPDAGRLRALLQQVAVRLSEGDPVDCAGVEQAAADDRAIRPAR